MVRDLFMDGVERLVPASLAHDGSSLTTLCMLFSFPQGKDDAALKALKNRSLDVSAPLAHEYGRTAVSDGVTAALYFAAEEHSDAWERPVESMFPELAHCFDALHLSGEQREHAHEAYLRSRIKDNMEHMPGDLMDDMMYLPGDPFMASLDYVSPFSGLIPAKLANDGSRLTAFCMLYPDHTGRGYSRHVIKNRSLDVSAALAYEHGRTAVSDGVAAALYFAAQEYCDKAGQSLWGMFPAIARDFETLGLTEEQQECAREAYFWSSFKDILRK